MGLLPTFIICGTQKGGTTALYHYLREHPEICMSKKKEVHFFDLNYHMGIKWYEKNFAHCNSGKVKAIGESSPLYMYLEEVPERIHETLPDIKLVFILRHPVDRAYSHYWHEVRLGYEYLSFRDAIRVEEDRLSRGDIFSRRHYSYKDRGKYIIQLKRFRKYFSDDQMLILVTEDLRRSPEDVMKKILGFIGVDTSFKSPSWYARRYVGKTPRFWRLQRLKAKIPFKILRTFIDYVNLKEGYPPMDRGIREYLLEFFKPYNRELEEFLGRRLNEWYR